MKAVWRVLGLIVQKQRWLFALGALLSVVVLLSGIALLGVSGWFITAAAAAGIAGVGAVFDVFRPSASIRFLAIGRTAGRYGERLITHDATMRALAGLRVFTTITVSGRAKRRKPGSSRLSSKQSIALACSILLRWRIG